MRRGLETTKISRCRGVSLRTCRGRTKISLSGCISCHFFCADSSLGVRTFLDTPVSLLKGGGSPYLVCGRKNGQSCKTLGGIRAACCTCRFRAVYITSGCHNYKGDRKASTFKKSSIRSIVRLLSLYRGLGSISAGGVGVFKISHKKVVACRALHRSQHVRGTIIITKITSYAVGCRRHRSVESLLARLVKKAPRRLPRRCDEHSTIT